MSPQLNCSGIALFHYAIETRAIKKAQGIADSQPPLLQSLCCYGLFSFISISSSPVKKKLFFIFHVLCLWIRYSSLTLPSTSSPATIAISLDKSEKLLVRRRRIVGSKRSMGFLVKISHINKVYQPEKLLLYHTMRDYKFGSDKVIIDGLQIFKMCPSLSRDHVYMITMKHEDSMHLSWTILQEAIVCVEDKQMSEFFFHLIRNQRIPISKGFLQTCGQHE
ncbi:hypothetical protein Bca4012_046044 [Brassica carinata]